MTLRHLRRVIREIEKNLANKLLEENSKEHDLKKLTASTEHTSTQEELRKKNLAEKNKDKLTLLEADTNSYYRKARICSNFKDKIIKLKDEVTQLIEDSTSSSSFVTEEDRTENFVHIKSKIETVKQLQADYKSFALELIKIADAKEVERMVANFSEVNLTANNLTASQSVAEAVLKKRAEALKAEKLEPCKLEVFNGDNESKYLNYFTWITQMNESILDRTEISSNSKLRYLKHEAHCLCLTKKFAVYSYCIKLFV